LDNLKPARAIALLAGDGLVDVGGHAGEVTRGR
jgi:hypothetical protein